MADNTPNSGPTTVVVDRGGRGTGLIIGLALLVLVAIGGYFVLSQTANDNRRTDAIAGAAQDVGDSARRAGAAAEKAVDPDK